MTRPMGPPSPAMTVAFVALLAALTGTAVALPGSNVVDSGDIRNGAVSTRDIKNNSVRSQDIRNGTVRGTDVNESSLGKVPSAARADTAGTANTATNAQNAFNAVNAGFAVAAASATAVGGIQMQPITLDIPDDSGFGPVLFQGIELSGDCGGGDFNVDARNGSGQEATLRVSGSADGAFYQTGDNSFTSGDADAIIPDDADIGQVTVQVGFADGTATTMLLGYSNGAGFDPNSCRIWGQVLSG